MKLNHLRNITLASLISLTTILSAMIIKNKYQNVIANLIIKKIKKQFKHRNIYGTWIYYSKKQHQYKGGINIKENNKVQSFYFITNFNGNHIKISHLK